MAEECDVRVYADMVGDLFHLGHVRFLQRVQHFGLSKCRPGQRCVVVVGVHNDADVASYKRTPIMTMAERVASVRYCRFVDEVVPDAPLRISRDFLREYRIDYVVHGDDSRNAVMYGVPIEMGIFFNVPYELGISTTDLIRRIKEAPTEKRDINDFK